tara:strand:- start:19972 stop:20181 length:210 start_codon:yes stop_codon:yes gene_type:complete
MNNKAKQPMTNLTPQHGGLFLTNANPSPLIQQVMEDEIRRMRAETQRRDRIRQGLESADWGTWNISDRH